MTPSGEALQEPMLDAIEEELQHIAGALESEPHAEMGRMIAYHFGWREHTEAGIQGKRIRPLFTLLVCHAAGGNWQDSIAAAASIELIHNFSLIHDDIEDNSLRRRGRPTMWNKWTMPQALNTGDALLILSQTAPHRLASSGIPADRILAVLRCLDRACLQLTIGQHLDLDFETREKVSTDEYMTMIGGKTSSLISAATEVGAMLAGAESDRVQAFADFGWHLGLAFQVQDDILGIWGEPAITGKPAGDDLIARKKTLPVLHGLQHSENFRMLWRQQAAKVQELRAALEAAGADEHARTVAEDHTKQALRSLQSARPEGPAATELKLITKNLLTRPS